MFQNWRAFSKVYVSVNLSPGRPKKKWKKSIKIGIASWHIRLKNQVSDFWQVHLLFCNMQMKLRNLMSEFGVNVIFICFIHSKIFQSDRKQRSQREKFTAHYSCKNADLNLRLVALMSNRFIFQIIDSLMQSWRVRLTFLDCDFFH